MRSDVAYSLTGILLGALLCVTAGVPEAVAEPDAGAADAEQAPPAEADFSAELEQSFEASEEVELGEHLELALDVEHPPGTSVQTPDDFDNPRWELLDTSRESDSSEESKQTSLTLTFQIFRPGATTLPSFPIQVSDRNGEVVELRTEPVDVRVASALPDDETPPLSGPRETVAVWTDDYTLAWVGGLLGALLAVGATLFVVGRRDDEEVEPGPPPRPAHVVALEKLERLTTAGLLEKDQYMLFYVRLSGAVREYLGRRYGFRGTELTTTEILDELEDVTWPEGLSHDDVRRWLQHCDLVKFSGLVPSQERAQQALRRGFSIVELTRPRPEPDAQTEDAQTEDAQTDEAEETEQAETPSDSDSRDAEAQDDGQPDAGAEARDDEQSDAGLAEPSDTETRDDAQADLEADGGER